MVKTDPKTVEQLLNECVYFDLRRTTRRIGNLYDQMIAPSGITSSQWSLLRAIDFEHHAAVAKLATDLEVDRTSLRRMLDPLERDGLITVKVDQSDRRARLVELTSEGRMALKQAHRHWKMAQDKLMDVLGEPAMRELVHVLRKANRAVRESQKNLNL
ncbi:MarR family transcriptional regulator [Pseudomonas sp. RGM2987]|uniref:MarR family winged helix-turn-helix transcriptional regulator n=1 Tax=Pseudomonas sp. RGM2987 TaxID=2930090 RepID=UPI001FD637AE|nr:MarR family transcriptional regulator [Pseudomonas sp. RGM2987]MCJ8207520.1 MarR family transcriptional regulator [Pseudomonas sp. RGM2987]